MAKWLLYLRSGRSRQFLTTDKSTGLGVQYDRAFLENTPATASVAVNTTPIDFWEFSNQNNLYPNAIEQAVTTDFFTTGVSYVSKEEEILQASAIEFGSVSSGEVFSSFDVWTQEGISAGKDIGGMVIPYRLVEFSATSAGTIPTSELQAIPATTVDVGVTVTNSSIALLAATSIGIMHKSSTGTPPGLGLAIGLRHVRSLLKVTTTLDLWWVNAGGNTTVKERSIDFVHALETGFTTSLYSRSVGIQYEQGSFALKEIAIDFKYALRTIQRTDSVLDILYASGVSESSVSFTSTKLSSNWYNTLLTLINGLRTSLSLPPYAAYAGGGIDIATVHANNMLTLGLYDHESDSLPAGWRTINDRKQQLGHYSSGVLENIALSGFSAPDVILTPAEVYDLWFNSPVHYDNMVYVWPDGADPTIQVGVAYSGRPPITSGGVDLGLDNNLYIGFYVLNIVGVGIPASEEVMQRIFNLEWSQTGALIEKYDFKWSQDAYKHVAVRHTTEYAIRVSAQSIAPWAVRAAAQHEAPQHYSVAAQHGADYTALGKIAAQSQAEYDLQQYTHAASSLSMPYGIKVQRGHGAYYGGMAKVVSSHKDSFDYLSKAAIAFSSPYADEVLVKVSHTDEYDLLLRNPVAQSISATYSLRNETLSEIVDVSSLCTVLWKGIAIRHGGVEISSSEDDFVWTLKMELTETDDYISIAIDDPVVVTMDGEVFSFIVTGKSLDRDSPSGVSMSISGHSDNVRFTDPRASTISYTLTTPKLASEIATEILGSSIIWNIVDWVIPPMYYAVENVTPISAVQSIVAAAGGILETTPAGQLVARYRFPVSVADYGTAAIDYLLTDYEDHLSYGESIDTTDVVNKLRIRNGSDSVNDSLEFIQDEGSDHSGIIRAYVLPWREVELRHTGGLVIAMSPLVVNSRVETEVVEIVDGAANLQYPAVSIQTIVWKSDPLGSLILEARTPNTTATDTTINYGYGLAEVTYVVECYQCSVEFPVGNVAQFILKDK